MATPDYRVLNSQLRDYFEALSEEIQERFLTVLQNTFQVKNRRNAELWVTKGQERRNFLNRSIGALELEMREAFLTALVNDMPVNVPTKVSDFGLNPFRIATKLRQYLSDNYTREAVISIGFLPDKTIYTYDAYYIPVEDDDIDDDASNEWDDIPTDPDPITDPPEPHEGSTSPSPSPSPTP